MTVRSNSRPLVGAAVMLADLERDPELAAFLIDRSRDVEIQDFLKPEVITGEWHEIADRARKALDGHAGRIGIHGPFYGFALDASDPDVRQIAKRRMLYGVEACARLATVQRQPHMVVHSPFTTWDWHNLPTRPGARETMVARIHDTLGEAVKRAENEGIVIVIENIEDKEPADRRDVARSFDSPAVRVSIDTGHAHYAHRATGAPPVDAFVRSAGDMLAHVHLQDGDGYADRHWRLGEGDIPWPQVFRAIGELSVSPRLVLEMLRPSDILPAARWLSEHGLAD